MKQSGNLNVERSAPDVSGSNPLDVERSALHSDADNPWPGLAPFTEAQSGRFFGREAEIKTLARRVQADPLTVLFGQSGLGKSSLLQAGVFPRLRSSDFCPIYIRLDHGPGAPPPAEQVKELVKLETARMGRWTKPEFEKPGESLWEFFHHRDHRLVSPGGIALSPVLVFDQFEELFTLGGGSGAERERAVVFITGLAELVENRPPEALEARLEQSSDEMDAFDFSRADYRVIITLREDYLPHLEGLKATMPTLMDSRMRLTRMNGAQALEAVVKPGAGLVTEEVGRAIVEFVAGARGGSAERLAELDVEPPLLSVICRELNERRRALGQAQITADLVSGNRREILHDFYERSVADLPEAMRQFVENKLLTKSGFRDNLALEAALEEPGVTQPLIDLLVSRRLLRIEDRIGTQRVELTHDVLADVVRASRDARQQRVALEQAGARERLAQRRHRTIIAGLSAAVIALLVGAFFGIRAQRRAEQAARDKAAESSRTDFIFGSRLLEDNKTPQGLAYLVRAARSDPNNHLVGPRLISALAYRSFAEPVGTPLTLPDKISMAVYVGDGRRAATYAGEWGRVTAVQFWDLEGGKVTRSFEIPPSQSWTRPSEDGRWLAAGLRDGTVLVWDTESGRQLFTVRHEQRIVNLHFSPDSRWLLVASADGRLSIWDARSGDLKATLPERADFNHFAISPDSSRFVTASGHFRIWRLPDGEPITPLIVPTGPNPGASWPQFGPDGTLFTVAHGATIQVYDANTGAQVGPRLAHSGQSVWGNISKDKTRVATDSSEGSVRMWEFPSGKLLRTLQLGGDARQTDFTPDSRHYVAGSGDGMIHVFEVETGRPVLEPIRAGGIRFSRMRSDGGELMTTGRDGVVRRWRFTPGAITPMETPVDSTLLALQRLAPDRAVAWAIRSDRMQPVDLLTGRTAGEALLFPAPVLGAVVSPNGQFIAVRTQAETAELWSVAGPEITRRSLPVPPGRALYGRRFSPDSAYLALNTPAGVQVIETRTAEVIVGPLPGLLFLANRTPIPFSPDSKYLVAYSAANTSVSLIDLRTRRVGEPIRHGQNFTLVHFSSDGRLIATSPEWGTIAIQDIAANRSIGEPIDLGTLVRGAVFSHDGTRLLTWTRLDMRLWDVASGRQLAEPMSGGVDYDPALFSPDDRRVATVATSSGEARIFDAASGSLICEPIPGSDRTNREIGSFTADGQFLITARKGGGVLVSPVPPHSTGAVPEWLLRLATGMAGGELDAAGKLHERALEPQQLEALRAELAALPKDAPYVEWGRWTLADRATRPIGPGFKITAAELARLRQLSAPAVGPRTSSAP